MDEVTDRLAAIFNTCGFDMVYFDGCEDVDRRRFDYYAANFQAVAMSKFQKRPIIHKGGGFHHNLWHSFTSSATIDQYPGTYLAYLRAGGTIDQWPTCKDHIDRTAQRVVACQDDMIPGELGWFGINPADGEYDGLQYDEIEYLMCKSLAYDSPISLQTSFSRMEQHPLNDDILALIKRYEALRHHQYGRSPIASLKRLSADDLERLKTPGKDFLIDTELWDAPMAIEMTRVTMPDDDVRAVAWLGRRRKTAETLAQPRTGRRVDARRQLAVGFVRCDGRNPRQTAPERSNVTSRRKAASSSRLTIVTASSTFGACRPRPCERHLRRPSSPFAHRNASGFRPAISQHAPASMAKGSAAGVEDPDAIGDFIVCTGKIDRSPAQSILLRVSRADTEERVSGRCGRASVILAAVICLSASCPAAKRLR